MKQSAGTRAVTSGAKAPIHLVLSGTTEVVP